MRQNRRSREKSYPENVFRDIGITDEPDYPMQCHFRALISPRGGCLSRDRCRILVMYYERGYSTAEIAAAFGTTENRIRRELSRIRHILKKNKLSIYYGYRYKRFSKPGSARNDFPWSYDFEDISFEDIIRESEWMMQEASKDPAEDIPVEDMELSVRSFNCLKRAGYHTAGSIAGAGRSELAKVRNLGRKSLDEITRKVEDLGFYFND